MWGYELDRAGSEQGRAANICECGHDPSVSTKCEEFIDYLRTGESLKKDSTPWSDQESKYR
jgi:hypothetical protein